MSLKLAPFSCGSSIDHKILVSETKYLGDKKVEIVPNDNYFTDKKRLKLERHFKLGKSL